MEVYTTNGLFHDDYKDLASSSFSSIRNRRRLPIKFVVFFTSLKENFEIIPVTRLEMRISNLTG